MREPINQNELDGVEVFDVLYGMNPMTSNHLDADNFYPADGGCGCGCGGGCGENHSLALGGLIPSRAELKKRREARSRRKDIRTQSKAAKRVAVGDSKRLGAEAQKQIAATLGQDTASDVEMAKALANATKGGSSAGGLSTGAKVGIAVGAIALLSLTAFLIYKKTKK
jgi:hypothetical protein